MADPAPDRTKVLLRELALGDQAARAQLFELLYGELKRIAAVEMRGGPPALTLQPTALVHEAWLRLVATTDRGYDNRRHFLGVAAKAMRSVLVDHARARHASKRGGGEVHEPIDEMVVSVEDGEQDVLGLEDALLELERDDRELGQIVELRFYCGLSHAEIAEVLSCSLSTVERSWRVARARLHRTLWPED